MEGHSLTDDSQSIQHHSSSSRLFCPRRPLESFPAVEQPEPVVSGKAADTLFSFRKRTQNMAEGTIKRLTDKGFGFIDDGSDKDMFFHMSNLEGVTFEELHEGQRVSYTPGHGPKGPRAENVKPI
jgi:CspA family cold shock protein